MNETEVETTRTLTKGQNVARQDSGVPEELLSPGSESSNKLPNPEEDELDGTINYSSECNVTVIHVAELENYKTEQETTINIITNEGKDSKDGSDSGVEGCATESARVRSRNSTDYASSCGGLDCEVSCDSSLVSCCSVYEDPCATLPDDDEDVRLTPGEGCSESSSIAGCISAPVTGTVKKKKEITHRTINSNRKQPSVNLNNKKINSEVVKSKSLSTSSVVNKNTTKPLATRTKLLNPTIPKQSSTTLTKDRINSRDKLSIGLNVKSQNSYQGTWTRNRNKQITDCSLSPLTSEINKDLASRASCVTPRSKLLTTPRSTMKPDDNKIVDGYATLPRRNKTNKINNFTSSIKNDAKTEKIVFGNCRSRSGSRDASLNKLTADKKRSIFNSKESSIVHKSLPPYSKLRSWTEKTRIYHEVAVQTGLTIEDIEKALTGVPNVLRSAEFPELINQHCQTEDDSLMKLNEENDRLKVQVEELKRLLEEEKNQHAFARKELNDNAERVMAMLGGSSKSEQMEASNSFIELESHFQSSEQIVANLKLRIVNLQSDLKKTLTVQESSFQQQQELEVETAEMQDFLQEEISSLQEALKEAETEVKRKEDSLTKQELELIRQTEECKHLVRISEQRRQENLSLSMKLNAVERKCRELLVAQGAAVSGAAVALSGLGHRLEALVDQLISSYSISEKDLEDVVYHNEAYSRSNSSIESSPVSSKHSLKECTPSPKSGSFVSAVIGAIRNAATHPFVAKTNDNNKSTESNKQIFKESSTEPSSDLLLDFETEPCLMMESVLEDVTLPDTYSHNMVSSSDSLRRTLSFPESRLGDESTSLTNLTQAILHRRKVQDEEEEGDQFESISETDTGINETNAPLTDYCPAVSLIDQVIDVDNLVTKLLKVLRIIQLDNDTCIQDLKEERSELEIKLDTTMNQLDELGKSLTLNQSEELLNNGTDRRRSIRENCRFLIKEVIADDIVNKL